MTLTESSNCTVIFTNPCLTVCRNCRCSPESFQDSGSFLTRIVMTTLKCPSVCYAESLLYWLFGPKNQSFRNKSGKTQPIRTKFGIRGQVKGRQRSENFGRDRPILAKMGAGTSPAEPEFFCLVNHATFRQLRNTDFHQIWSRNVVRYPVDESAKTFSKIFTLEVICPQNLKANLGQTGTSLRAGYSSRNALQRDNVYSTL